MRREAVRDTRPSNLADWAAGVVLVILILLVYAQVGHFSFTYYDDPDYVTRNAHVQSGLSLANIAWAFTSSVSGNWSPVTTLSHMLAFQLFGMDSGMHHLINVLVHALAALFLFASLTRATRSRWASFFVALVFAVHPLHVESVAWVSERKDVLSAFFWFAGLYAYVRYTERPTVARNSLVATLLALGLMSKTMLVTFPFTLLLFDLWPLNRPRTAKLVWEKLPLFGLCAASSIIAFLTQKGAGAISPVALPLRLENALVSTVIYVGQTLLPVRLSPMYPYPESIPLWQPAAAFVLLAAITAGVLAVWRTRPYLATGWFFYLGTLVPVIGIVQVGSTAHADRYTYIPMVGLSIMAAWGGAEVVARWPGMRWPISSAAAACIVAFTVLAALQTSYWQDGVRLFQHAVDIAPDNFPARFQLSLEHYLTGKDLLERGQRGAAIEQFQAALQVRPNWAEVHNNLGIQLGNIPGRASEALSHFETAVRLNPKLVEPRRNLGLLEANMPGRRADAIANLEAAQRMQADPEAQRILDRLRSQ